VRGLDYYRRTAFEIHADGIGAQSALGGGGRYDGLVAQLGGPDVPGIGWAFGIERVLDALEQAAWPRPRARPLLYLVPMDDDAVAEVAGIARELRAHASAWSTATPSARPARACATPTGRRTLRRA
jgi:histidyl-tRNA synthetase